MRKAIIILSILSIIGHSCLTEVKRSPIKITSSDSLSFSLAVSNSLSANEAFIRCSHYIDSWLEHTDSVTGLIPRNLDEDTLYIHIATSSDWEGKVYFDCKRHQDFMNLHFDYPRINQFPEWWTIKPDSKYLMIDAQKDHRQYIPGKKLLEGLPVKMEKENSKQFYLVEIPSSGVL